MRRTARSALTLAILLGLTTSSTAGPQPPPTNILYGFLTTNRTLTYAPPGPFYYLPGDLVVRPGVTLTIEPGVHIACSPNDTLGGGVNTSLVELTVQGRLLVAALPPDSARIQSVFGQVDGWHGVRSEGAGVLDLQGLSIRGAYSAIDCAAGGPHTLRFLNVSNVTHGITTGYSQCQISDCRILGRGSSGCCYYVGNGLQTSPNSQIAFPDSTDARPTTVAGFQNGVLAYSQSLIRNVIARDNEYGVTSSGAVLNYCTFVRNRYGTNAGQSLILNSIIALNSAYAVINTNDSFTDYCDVWNSGIAFATYGLSVGPNIASFNPFFLNAVNNDFRLGAGSVFKHYSNSQGELGAFGPGAGLPVGTRKTSWGRLKALYR